MRLWSVIAGKSGMHLGIFLFTGLALLVSNCGKRAAREPFVDRNPPVQDADVAPDPVGHYGGVFKDNSTSDPKTFNPIMAEETSSTQILGFIFSGLTRFTGAACALSFASSTTAAATEGGGSRSCSLRNR